MAKQKLSATDSVFATNQIFNKVPVQSKLEFFNAEESPIYPVCNTTTETWEHLITYNHKESKVYWIQC